MSDDGQPSKEVPAGFQAVEHTADWALRIWGSDLGELFRNAALGMSSLLAPDLSLISRVISRRLELEADDVETLLVDWLSELAYWAEAEGLIFTEYYLSDISASRLTAVVRGGRVGELLKHIKAVTYHDLRVVQTSSGFETTIVFDV